MTGDSLCDNIISAFIRANKTGPQNCSPFEWFLTGCIHVLYYHVASGDGSCCD